MAESPAGLLKSMLPVEQNGGLSGVQSIFFPGHKPDRTRGSEFAVYVGITAIQAFLTEINVVLHALVGSIALRVVGAFSHA
jgi:hypothetical protein